MKRLLALAALPALVAGIFVSGAVSADGHCWPWQTAVAQLSGSPAWCHDLADSPVTTFENRPNGWVDEFEHGLSMAGLGAGYRVFENAGASVNQTRHFRHANHWMVDVNGVDEDMTGPPWNFGGAAMRPDRAFRAEGGKLVVETVVSLHSEYSGSAWPELVVTTRPDVSPVGRDTEQNYLYNWFPGHYTLGCRLESQYDFAHPVCALHDNTDRAAGSGGRIWEISDFQHGVSPWGDGAAVKYGGNGYNERAGVSKVCVNPEDPDITCRNLFRWEIEKDRHALYVNGVLYMEHAGFPAAQQVPDALLNGDVYVYFGSWIFKPDAETTRFHWDRVAVNPSSDGNPLPTPTPIPPTATPIPATPTATPVPERVCRLQEWQSGAWVTIQEPAPCPS